MAPAFTMSLLLTAVVSASGGAVAPLAEESEQVVSDGGATVAYTRQTWTRDDGLPDIAAECLLQTRDGWLWVGTRNGLARFDGLRFTVFDSHTDGFTDDAILALAEDPSGDLWIATKKGLYRKSHGALRKYTSEDGLLHDHVAGLHVSSDGGLWVATHGGLNRFQDDVLTGFPLEEIVHDPPRDPEVRRQVLTVAEDHARNVWVGTLWGLEQLHTSTGRFLPVWHDPLPPVWPQRAPAQVVFIDRNGGLWCGTDDALVHLQGALERVYRFEADGGDIRLRRIVQAPDDEIWVVRAGKLFRVQGDRLIREDERFGLADSYVTDILFSPEGIVWVATRYRGLQCFRPTPVRVFTTRDGLCHNSVVSVCPSREGGLWVGTVQGLMRLRDRVFAFPETDPIVRKFVCRSILEESNGDLWVGTAPGPEGNFWRLEKGVNGYRTFRIPNVAHETAVLFEDRQQRLWVGGHAGFVCFLPDDPGQVQREDPIEVESDRRAIRWFFDSTRVLKMTRAWWMEFSSNTWRLSKDPATWMPLSAAPADLLEGVPFGLGQRFSSYDIRAVLEDRRGVLWFGTSGGGVHRVHNGRIDVLTTREGLAGDQIQALHEDADGVLWIGTTRGLSRVLDRNGARAPDTEVHQSSLPHFVSFTKADGLPDDGVNQILEDASGNLWIGCDQGIYRVSKRALAELAAGAVSRVDCLLLNEDDGLLGGQTHRGTQPSACKTPDGRLWFATPQGLACVDPDRVSRDNSQPEVFVERLRVGDQWIELLDGPPPQFESHTPQSEIEQSVRPSPAQVQERAGKLPAGSGRSLEFEFTALEYFAPKRPRFRYRLVGLNGDWQDAGERRIAFFTNLKPRAYQFEVQAASRDGRWTDPGASLAFSIAPFFWETWWFRGASTFGAALLLSGCLYLRIRQWQRTHEEEKRDALAEQHRIQHLDHLTSMAKERDRLARDLHDELAGELTRIALLEQGEAASLPVVRRASQIARTAIDSLGELIWATDPSYDTLDNLAAYLRQLTLRRVEDTGVTAQFVFPETLSPRRVTARLRREMVLLVKESLTNTARHASATTVTVGLDLTLPNGNGSPPLLELWIQDNGCGFDRACLPSEPSRRRNARHGLRNMRRRISELGGEFGIDTAPGQGTTVRVRVPLPDIE